MVQARLGETHRQVLQTGPGPPLLLQQMRLCGQYLQSSLQTASLPQIPFATLMGHELILYHSFNFTFNPKDGQWHQSVLIVRTIFHPPSASFAEAKPNRYFASRHPAIGPMHPHFTSIGLVEFKIRPARPLLPHRPGKCTHVFHRIGFIDDLETK